ncbi:MAG TPA: MFS transporter [Thermoleophilia bacterium]|nr:MFS transporter [Thermoleophilia bacterium]HVP05552.1 MFS transporter [Dehalococcoidia bacterium]
MYAFRAVGAGAPPQVIHPRWGRSRGKTIEAEAIPADVHPAPLTRNRAFQLLWAGQFVSQLGDRLAALAFPWLVWKATGSALGTGGVFALYTLPWVIFGAFSGVVVDRTDKRRLMIAMDVVRAVLVLVVPFLATRSLSSVFVLAFVIASLGVLFEPAKLAIVPEIVPAEQLLRANSLLSTGENLTEILGSAVAGLLLVAVGTSVTFQLDALTFAVSALALVLMRYRAPARDAAEKVAGAFWRELNEGLSFLRRDPGVRANTTMIVVCVAGLGAVYPLTFLFAVNVLNGGAGVFGALEAIISAGFLVGSLALVALATRVHKGRVMIGGLLAMGACLALVPLTGSVWTAAVPFVLFGIANAVVLIAVDTFLQQSVPEGMRGRVLGTRFMLTQGTYAVSVLAGGALAGVVDVRVLFVVAGAIVAVSGLVGLASREVRRA